MKRLVSAAAMVLACAVVPGVSGEGGLRTGALRRPDGHRRSGCSCDGADNHGRFVSCVAHVVKDLVADGTVPVNCKGKVVSCAAKSTCGKPGFVRCLFPTDTCVVDPVTLLGTCAENPALACSPTSTVARSARRSRRPIAARIAAASWAEAEAAARRVAAPRAGRS